MDLDLPQLQSESGRGAEEFRQQEHPEERSF